MDGVLPIVFLAVILKIPVFFGLWLIWWAVRAEPEMEEDAGGAEDHTFRRWRRDPSRTRGPRRGPHGGAAHAQPERSLSSRVRASSPQRTRQRA